ncbi:helix-turn-helix domain-containing protein [Halomonas sp. M5N1S17]|uniref:GlxA family transcriptional regulator n=1 Tax=Halomonas alkalisoli TaxID=2907158 RepID=UPI001F335545|nr:helix-turn-helix domain-containing protein [Halomonas alkalisoli]MCE9661966.1 helix-turn-helix domain-containing protein [Halomonas alkalisoli]
MHDVTVVLVEGGMPSTAVAPLEIFGTAGVLWNFMCERRAEPRFRVRTVSKDGRPVRTGVSLLLQPDCGIEAIESTDLILVAAVGADLEAAFPLHAALYPWLREWHERGATIAGVCAGVALLAEAGILDDRPATTHWAVVDACRRRYPRVHWQPERVITESGNVLCSGGVYAAVDLSLYLIEKLCGHKLAMETARALVLETPRTWQIGYGAEPPEYAHEDQRIQKAQEWLFRHFTDIASMEQLARNVGMSERTFERRFKRATGETPRHYLHRVRVNAARHLLENEQQSVQEVSSAVGYDDVSHFRRLFKRHTGMTPQAYRENFGAFVSGNVARVGRTPHH